MADDKNQYNAPIDLLMLEYLLGNGLTGGDAADYLGFNRSTLYKRQKKDLQLAAAFNRGYAANELRKQRIAEEAAFIVYAAKRPDEDVGAVLQQTLEEVHSEVKSILEQAAV